MTTPDPKQDVPARMLEGRKIHIWFTESMGVYHAEDVKPEFVDNNKHTGVFFTFDDLRAHDAAIARKAMIYMWTNSKGHPMEDFEGIIDDYLRAEGLK